MKMIMNKTTDMLIYKILSLLLILTFPFFSLAQEPFDKLEIQTNLNSIDSFINDTIYPLIAIVDKKSLYQNIEKIDISKIGGCDSFATTMAAKFLNPKQNLTNNKERCDFFRLSVNICTLNRQIKKILDDHKTKKYNDAKISTRLGFLVSEGYQIKLNVNRCNEWASSLE